MTDDALIQIPIASLHESPFNPRKIFDEVALRSLADDIKSVGRVMQPLLVRPRVPPLFSGDADAITGHEIVFGHRRFRAAAIAGLTEVPCMVRTMTDEEAKRAQISENIARKDVHPIEEAEGYQALIDGHNHTAELLAEQFGKSRSYVYGRLKLLEACPEIRKACLAGEIGSEVALLIARLRTVKLQEKALGYIRKEWRANLTDGGKQSYRAIRDLLNEKFTLDLQKAIFDIEDEMLVPSAGHCIRCTKRTANAPEFDDVLRADGKAHPFSGMLKHVDMAFGHLTHKGADVCTDPDCFDDKKKAHLQREADKLKAAGKVVVTGNAARGAVSAHGEIKGGYISLKDVKEQLAKARVNAQKDSKVVPPQIFTIQDPRNGKTHQAIKASELVAAGVKLSEPKKPSSSSSSSRDWDRERKERQAIEERETKFRKALHARVRAAAAAAPRTVDELRLIARYAIDMMDYEGEDDLAKLWGKKSDALSKALDKFTPDNLALLLIDITLLHGLNVNGYAPDEDREHLDAAAKLYGVDVDQVRAELSGTAPTPSTAAQAPQKAAAGAGAKKAKKKPTKAANGADSGQPELPLDDQGDDQGDDAGVAGERSSRTTEEAV